MGSDPATLAWLDQQAELVAQNIRHHGVHLTYVMADPARHRTSLCYTVGLFGLGHPELLVCGLSPDTASGMLNYLAGEVRGGRQILPGELLTFPQWPHRAVAEQSPNPGKIAFTANAHYQRPDEYSVPLLQLTLDDTQGRFPWDEGYSFPTWLQPRPGTFRA